MRANYHTEQRSQSSVHVHLYTNKRQRGHGTLKVIMWSKIFKTLCKSQTQQNITGVADDIRHLSNWSRLVLRSCVTWRPWFGCYEFALQQRYKKDKMQKQRSKFFDSASHKRIKGFSGHVSLWFEWCCREKSLDWPRKGKHLCFLRSWKVYELLISPKAVSYHDLCGSH